MMMRTIIVTSDNLFSIAARELGDATQWIRIAKLNRLSDPFVTGVQTLKLPLVDPNAGGGVDV